MEGIIILIVTLSSVIIIMQVCYIIKAMNYFYFFPPVDPKTEQYPLKRLYGLLSSCVSSVKIIKEVLWNIQIMKRRKIIALQRK